MTSAACAACGLRPEQSQQRRAARSEHGGEREVIAEISRVA